MSNLGNWLKQIGHDIAAEEQKIFNGIVNELETVILPAAITATNAIKELLDGDSTDIIGSVISKAGPAIEDKVRAALDNIVPKLQLAQTILTANPGTDANTVLVKIVQILKVSPAETQTAFWIEFSGLLTTALQTKLSVADAVVITQWFFKNLPTGGSTAQPDPVPVIGAPAVDTTATS